MPSAYVLIASEAGCEKVVMDELKTITQVIEAHKIYGYSYDMIVKVNADTNYKLNQIISLKIRRIEKAKARNKVIIEYLSYLERIFSMNFINNISNVGMYVCMYE